MLQNNYNLGGEPSGHVLLTDHSKTGDGLLTAIKIVSLLKQSGKKASEFLRPFKMTPYKIINLQNISKKVLETPHVLHALNSLKIKLSNKGRILVRPSGTEPLVRVLVESKDENLIDKYINEISKILKEAK